MNNVATIDKSIAPMPGGRPGVSKRLKFNWASNSKPGVFMMISKKELYIDEEAYQREQVSKQKVLEIARNFDWRLFGALSVVLRDDQKFYVFDGGHRKRAAQYRDDIDMLPCMVFEAESIADEAKGFVGSNKIKSNVSALHMFNASVAAGEPSAVQARLILEKLGLEAVQYSGRRSQFRAIGNFLNMVKIDAALAEHVLLLCHQITSDDQPISGEMMKGIWYLARTESIGDAIFDTDICGKLIIAGSDVVEAEMRRVKAINGKGGPAITALGILNVINKNKRNKLKLETN